MEYHTDVKMCKPDHRSAKCGVGATSVFHLSLQKKFCGSTTTPVPSLLSAAAFTLQRQSHKAHKACLALYLKDSTTPELHL